MESLLFKVRLVIIIAIQSEVIFSLLYNWHLTINNAMPTAGQKGLPSVGVIDAFLTLFTLIKSKDERKGDQEKVEATFWVLSWSIAAMTPVSMMMV